MDQVTFADVLQKSFVAMAMGSTERITTLNIVLNCLMSFAVGMFIFFIYKRSYQGVLYQRSFNISLVLASVVTSLVIMTISGNLILSLGMVGALSIVRFRTPIKDSMDLIFLFWAISAGIANGVGYYNISVVGSLLIASFLLLLTSRKTGGENAFLLVMSIPLSQSTEAVLNSLKEFAPDIAVKAQTLSDQGTELTVEARLLKDRDTCLQSLRDRHEISQVSLVAYDQDLSSV